MANSSGLVWSGLAWPAPRQSVAKCWCKHHSSGCGQLVYWHENLSKMHHAFIFIIRKHKNNVLDIWPGPNDNVATCCHVFGADYETQLSSAPARLWLWLWLWLRLELELCRCQAGSLPLSLAGSQSAWEEGGSWGKEGGLLSWAPFGVPRILHSNTNQTGPPIDTRYSPLKRSFIMLLKFNK